MLITKRIFLFIAAVLCSIILLRYAYAENDGTLSQEATVPVTQSTIGMDGQPYDESEGLLVTKLDISDPVDRQKLLANFDRESGILKNMGLSADELKALKEAIINGDQELIEKIYRKARVMAEANNE